MVANGACVRVFALALIERFMHAPFLPLAHVLRALCTVIAKTDKLPVHESRLIGFAVAIVVRSVAHFESWLNRVALSKPIQGAYSLAAARPGLV